MELFLMRHAEAEPPTLYAEDRQRPLSPHGLLSHERVARQLAPLLRPLDHLLTSPYLRARQTADIIAAAIAMTPEETSLLAEDCTPGAVLNQLATYPPDARLLCVGHEPHMSRLSALFLDGEGRSVLAFQPGSVSSLTFRGHPRIGLGTLQFFLRPEDLLTLARETSAPTE